MTLNWSSLTFAPQLDALHQLRESWGWLVAEPFTPVLFSTLGDVFLERESGGVWWLNTGTGKLSQVAATVQEFEELLKTDLANKWFLPHLVAQLHAAGKIPSSGECYTFVVLPVFSQGKYEVANLNVVAAGEHYGVTGHLIREIHDLPDGARVRVRVTPTT